jgi:hypothetical protein
MPTFSNHDASQYPRLFQKASSNSALYTLQSDCTKVIAYPTTANDLISGTANAAYSVITSVPAGAKGFIPYWMPTVTLGSTSAEVASLSITATHASLVNMYVMFFGRFDLQASPYANDPYAYGSSTSNPAGVGYWRPLARINYTASSGGTATVISYPRSGGQSFALACLPSGSGTSNLTQVFPTPIFASTKAALPSQTLADNTGTGFSALTSLDQGAIPTLGSNAITAALMYYSSTAGTVTLGAPSMQSGTGTFNNLSIAANFIS